MNHLIEKYNIAAPRYTSYPTVPHWDAEAPAQETWKQLVRDTFIRTNESEGISLYIHLPFCESLCTYCGCNTRITVNHKVELPYITAVLTEWTLYLGLMETIPRIRELHLGGGTPTFFSPDHLTQLVEGILQTAYLCPDAVLSFEGHPDNTTPAHLEALHALGFTRISLGIQDFDPEVQRVIHRIQSFGQVSSITEQARRIGYSSVNYDLIYGLPLQTPESMALTVEKVIRLRPDRIAFYSYAHVPWLKPGQRSFTEADLPDGPTKRLLYELGRDALEQAGYAEIGMDHFALPEDPLHAAVADGSLHRNFMGYTTTKTELLIGLGVSSISDTWSGFVQNEKHLEAYYQRLAEGEFPFFKGHVLTETDRILRRHILSLMCRLETSWEREEDQCEEVMAAVGRLAGPEADGLVELTSSRLIVTLAGQPFLRVICMAFDARMHTNTPVGQVFSKTI